MDTRFPVKGDTLRLVGCSGTSNRTVWNVVTNIDSNGFGTLKSVKSGKKKRVVLNDMMFFKYNPAYKSSVDRHVRYINPPQIS